jgi:predicted nucleic acid-binding protein
MRRVFVDTSAWYDLALPESTAHDLVAEAVGMKDTRFVTSTFVLHELVALLINRRNHVIAAKTALAIRQAPEVRMEHPDPAEEAKAWLFFLDRADKTYTLTDCLSFCIMRRLGITEAITTDAHFRQEGFTVLV